MEYGETQCDEPTRYDIARRLGEALDVDFAKIAESRMLSLVDADNLCEMAGSGIDIELHTHRHRFPTEPAQALRELEENRAALAPYLNRPLEHFCYPSGAWSRAHWAPLTDLGVVTATTCDPGLVYRDTPRLALNRFLDSHRVEQIRFEAAMYGYTELVHRVRRVLSRGRNARNG